MEEPGAEEVARPDGVDHLRRPRLALHPARVPRLDDAPALPQGHHGDLAVLPEDVEGHVQAEPRRHLPRLLLVAEDFFFVSPPLLPARRLLALTVIQEAGLEDIVHDGVVEVPDELEACQIHGNAHARLLCLAHQVQGVLGVVQGVSLQVDQAVAALEPRGVETLRRAAVAQEAPHCPLPVVRDEAVALGRHSAVDDVQEGVHALLLELVPVRAPHRVVPHGPHETALGPGDLRDALHHVRGAPPGHEQRAVHPPGSDRRLDARHLLLRDGHAAARPVPEVLEGLRGHRQHDVHHRVAHAQRLGRW